MQMRVDPEVTLCGGTKDAEGPRAYLAASRAAETLPSASSMGAYVLSQ